MKKLLILIAAICSFTSQAQENTLRPLDINLENYQYPYPVSFIHLKIQQQDIKMAYMDVQPVKANGKSVLLLHGKNFNGAYWEQTARTLADNGYRVIIPDQVGFGKSSKPQHLQYTFQLLAANTKALLDTLGIQKIIVVCHSMGG